MRVLSVMLEYLPTLGGAQVCVDQIVRQHAAVGHDVAVVSGNQRSRALQSSLPYDVIVAPPGLMAVDRTLAGSKPSRRRLAAGWLAQLVRQRRPDLVHAHMLHSAGVMSTIQPMTVPVVVTCHGVDVQQLPAVGYGVSRDEDVRAQLAHVISSADIVTYVGDRMQADLERIAGGPVTNSLRIVNGCATARIERFTVDRDDRRAALGIAPNEVAILCLGRNHPKKNFAATVQIAAILEGRLPAFKFVCVGEGYDVIIDEANLRGVGDHFITAGPFLGEPGLGPSDFPLDEQLAVMKACDVMVLPTLIEGFPLVIPEALAAGLPVVTTHEAGVSGVFADRVVRIVENDNARLAAAIAELAHDASGGALAPLCRDQARRVDWSAIADQYLELYASLVSPGVAGRARA